MKIKRIIPMLLAGVITLMAPLTVMADAVTDQPFVALGADLTDAEKQTVLTQLNLTGNQLAECKVIEITNADEHQYLDSYLDKSVIGTRALSSCMVTGKEDGYGIKVTTKNISYCTVGMYENALATAGIKNADIVVAAPFSISGTAGLVGAIKAYETMTGNTVSTSSVDTATDELVTTGEIAESVGDTEKAEQLIAIVKDKVASEDLSEEEVNSLIDQASKELDINLSESDRAKISDLMSKIDDLNLNSDDLKSQISGLYDEIKGLDLNLSTEDKAKAESFLSSIWSKLESFINSIIG